MTDETITNDDDVIVEVEGEDSSSTEATTTDSGESRKGADPAEELRAQFREKEAEASRERAAREQAQREAAQHRAEAERARQEAAAAQSYAVDADYGHITAGIEAANAEITSAKQAIKLAGETGDYDKQVEAYDRLADARARMVALNGAKADLEARKAQGERRQQQTEQRQQQQTQTSDPVESFIATRSEPTQKWLREHRDLLTDPKKNNKLTAAHYDAVGEGLTLDTKEYFDHVEKYLGLRKDESKANGKEQSRAANGQFRRGSAPPVAPVGSSGGGTNGGGTEVRLTKGEAQAATDGTVVWNFDDPSGKKKFKKGDPIGVAEFARRKLEMQRQGLYDKSYTEQ